MKHSGCIKRSQGIRHIQSWSHVLVFSVLILIECGLTPARAALKNNDDTLLNRPVLITSRTEPVLDMAISRDGKYIVYITGEDKPTTLWLASADPAVIRLPKKLSSGASVKSHPAISSDNRYIAYVDTDFDVKGDIYLIDREDENSVPVRLTGRDTEDGGPCFSEDGRFLYFHQATGNHPRGLAVLDLKNANLKKGAQKSMPIDTGGDAMFCDLSPDNRKLAFVSTRDDASGDIFIFNTDTRTVVQMTSGPAIDMFPRWHANSRTLYFSRIGSDTNHDGKLSPDDHSVICRIQTDSKTGLPFPVTLLDQVSFNSYTAGGRLYFISSRGGVSNCWSVDEEGYIQTQDSAEQQFNTADLIKNRIPYDPYQTLLAYVRVVEKFPDQKAVSAKAGFHAAAIFQDLNLPASALGAYQFVRRRYTDILPESALALIRQTGIQFDQSMNRTTRAAEKKAILEKSLALLDKMSLTYPGGSIAAEAKIESVRILLSSKINFSDMPDALNRLEQVLTSKAADDSQKARAMLLKARVYDITTGSGQEVINTLRDIIIDYPKQRKWVDEAVDQILSYKLARLTSADQAEKIRQLNLLAIENTSAAPPLAMGAFNRIGDLYYDAGDLVQAKTAYQNVLTSFPILTTQTAAARLSLAEILFREERFRDAIDLYEKEISLRSSNDRIYQLARRGYIRKNIAAAEYLFRLSEIPAARSLFRELIDYDDRIIEAHRGYIKCAAAAGDIATVLQNYRNRLQSNPDDPVWLYCTGLCMTYLNTEDSAETAAKLIEKAVQYNSGIEYFHQTLGYTYEVLETVYKRSGQLEPALMSYQKAYFLNDHENNPDNAANLELNIGNIYYLLGQYGKAFDFYSRRDARNIEFSDPDTEIVFYKRWGESAFQNNEIPRAIKAFVRAIQLIDAHIDPRAPSRAFDRLNHYIREKITIPAGNLEKTKPQSEIVARRQSEQNLKVAALSSEAGPPPSIKWQAYKKKMTRLLQDQKPVNADAAKLAETYNDAIEDIPGSLPIENARQNLDSLCRRIREALEFPERLIELKAEILDHLGLAYQENGDWQNARETFEKVFSINEKTGKRVNLARNRRSVAYNTYQLARSATGDQRIRLLTSAAADFNQALSLVDLYGVPVPEKQKRQGLLDISVSTSLDKTSTTQAAGGFSKSQEKRLAQTFISRIQMELGNFRTARDILEKQLKEYPDPEKIKEKDLYGVSLLYHRAGLFDNGENDFSSAFDNFAVSSNLCLKLENPISAAINILNMAAVGQQMLTQNSSDRLSHDQITQFQALDRQTEALLSDSADIAGADLLMDYHSKIGVFYFSLAGPPDASPLSAEDAVIKMDLQQQAVTHFHRGIAFFEKKKAPVTRHILETAAALYFNLGVAATTLHDVQSAERYFKRALSCAKTGVFPDIEWRALAGLGRTPEALAVLETVPITRAGCRPGEIIHSLGGLVFEKLNQKKINAALTLAEKLSELERFNRTAPFIRPADSREKTFFTNLYPRLERITALEDEYAGATEARRPFIMKRLQNEKTLLVRLKGRDDENLPPLLRNISNKETRNLAVFLMALSQHIEQTADDLAAKNILINDPQHDTPENRRQADMLSDRYHDEIQKWRDLCEAAYFNRPIGSPPDFISLLAPEPFDVMDLSEKLRNDDTVVRIFHPGNPHSPSAVFFITKNKTTAFTADTLDAVTTKINQTIDRGNLYIATENPLALNFDRRYPYALSAKHLERCINNRKAFKRKLLTLPEMELPERIKKDYSIASYSSEKAFDPAVLFNLMPQVNTLLLLKGPSASATIPTEPGQVAHRFFALYPDNDRRMALHNLLARSSNLSLSMISAENADHLYLTGHLFSLYGCPSMVFIAHPGENAPLVSKILTSYLEMSGFEALTSATEPLEQDSGETLRKEDVFDTSNDRLLYLGYRGMSRKESARFAAQNFINYVKSGRSAFDTKEYLAAAVMFENAITVANEIPKYKQYLPDLYKYARESAYLAGDMDQALFFAKKLADLYQDTAPSASAHAEALLRLGLMYAKKDDYQNAIPIIERAVDDMSQLPEDENLVQAIMDLGIVLENATNYERALSRFKAAADLSRTLNRSELLGEQYLNIGRVYDLRMNQYATAIQNYEKALEIYTVTGDTGKVAESMLDIGRCYRLLGNFDAATRNFNQSMALISGDSDDQQLLKAKILIEQANNAWFQGKYQDAFQFQRECYHIAETLKSSAMRVIAQNTEGLIWWSLGDYQKALAVLNDALTTAKNLSARKDELSSTLNNIGLIYRDMGEFQKAMKTFDQAIAIDTEIDSKWGLAYDLRNKGLTFMKLDQPKQAAQLFDQAYEISSAIGNRINAAKSILAKGDALFSVRDYPEAEKAYQAALALSETMMIRETQWRALFGLAKIQIFLFKDTDKAETLLRQSIDIIEQLRSDIRVNQLKKNFIANKLDVYETLVQLLANQQKPAEAFEIAERSRARNFIDLLGGQPIGFVNAEEETLYQKQQIIKSEIETNEQLLAISANTSERGLYEKTLRNLKHELENVMIDMQLQNPQLASMVSVPPVTMEKLISRLEPETALLSYYLLDNEIFCWILRSAPDNKNNRLKLVRIPAERNELNKKILEYRRMIQNLEPYEKHARELYDLLIEPVRPYLAGVRTIGICPHGYLHYLSFATLLGKESFLLDQYSLFYVPSAAVLEYTLSRRTTRPYRSPRVLAVGNPDLGNSSLDLPFAEKEVNSIKWDFPEVTILTREKAREDWIVNHIADFDIIHIASHGEFDPVRPLMSAIKLAGSDDKTFTKSHFDGSLEASEIFGLNINADMVFLSACQTGLGKISAGDDVVGLNRSFFYAGTHTVISSLWRVSDVSTAVLIKTFYRLYMNRDKADCLKQAAMHVKTRYPHPGYWGAFTLVGDYY